MAFEDGPYVQAACFCEMVIQDKENVLSLIRVIDTLNRTAIGPNPPRDMPEFTQVLKFVLMLKSGNAHGRSDLKIVPELPTGEMENPVSLTVHFEGNEKGHNIVADFNFGFKYEGLYWFRIYLDDQKFTAIPMRVKYDRVVASAMPTTGP